MDKILMQIDRFSNLADEVQKVGQEFGAVAMLSVIGTAVDLFAEREGIGQEGAKEMLERLMTIQGEVWKAEGDFFGGGNQWND